MSRLRPRIALALLLIIVSTAFLPVRAPHVHAGEIIVPAEWRQAHPGPYTIDVALLVDREWVARFGPDARGAAYEAFATAEKMFEAADIHLRVSVYGDWESPEGAGSIVDLLDALERSGHPEGADIVVGLTDGYTGKDGGAARPRHPYVVVKHHPFHLERDGYVLTHEIAHTLGLSHHSCPDGRCIMADHDYDPREHWCDEHLELLKANGGFFQYALDAAPQP